MAESPMLGFGLEFEDLYRRDGLVRLDGAFVDVLKARSPELHDRLMAARAALASEASGQRGDPIVRAPEQVAGKDESDLIVALAPELEDFVGELFGIVAEMNALRARHDALAPLYGVKRLFVQRRAAKKYTPEQAAAFDGPALRRELEPLIGGELTELRFAEKVDAWMKAEAEHRRGTRTRGALRRLGRPHAGGPRMPTRAACCSRSRTRSTRTTWCRSRPRSSTASRCSSCRARNAAPAMASR